MTDCLTHTESRALIDDLEARILNADLVGHRPDPVIAVDAAHTHGLTEPPD